MLKELYNNFFIVNRQKDYELTDIVEYLTNSEWFSECNNTKDEPWYNLDMPNRLSICVNDDICAMDIIDSIRFRFENIIAEYNNHKVYIIKG